MERKKLLAICRKYLGSDNYYYPKVSDQIDRYTEELGLTCDDIAQILKYWYEIKKSDPTRSGGGIGIVPHIYKEALDYWQKEEEYQKISAKIQDYEPPKIITFQARTPYMEKPKTIKLFDLK